MPTTCEGFHLHISDTADLHVCKAVTAGANGTRFDLLRALLTSRPFPQLTFSLFTNLVVIFYQLCINCCLRFQLAVKSCFCGSRQINGVCEHMARWETEIPLCRHVGPLAYAFTKMEVITSLVLGLVQQVLLCNALRNCIMRALTSTDACVCFG